MELSHSGDHKNPKSSLANTLLKAKACGKPTHGKSVSISVVYQLRWKILKVYTDGK